jgi:phosphoserine phosphatase RsbU/P
VRGDLLRRFNPRTQTYEVVPPVEVVDTLNRRFQSKDDRYFTIVYGLLDCRTGKVSLTQAGHPNPLLMRRNGSVELFGGGGAPVGILPDVRYEEVQTCLNPGDRLILYSDGIVECAEPQGSLFGEGRLMDYLNCARTEPLPDLLDGLVLTMENWHGQTGFDDDVSLLVLDYQGTGPDVLSASPEGATR